MEILFTMSGDEAPQSESAAVTEESQELKITEELPAAVVWAIEQGITTNAGSTGGSALGFGKDQSALSSEKTLKALREFLRPEFLGRVDEVVCFAPLTQEDFARIAVLMLTELKESLAEKGYSFTWDEALPSHLAQQAFGGSRGARDLRNVVRRQAEDKIATALIDHADTEISGFILHQDQLEIVK